MISEKVVKIIFAIIMARYLGADSYGLLMYAYSFVFIFSPFFSLGLDTVTEKHLISSPKKEKTYLATVFFMKVVGSSIAFIFIFISWLFLPTGQEDKILIGLLGLSFFFQQVSVFDLFFRANILAKYISFAKFSGLLVKGFIIVVLLYLDASLIWFAASYAIETFISFIITGIFYYKKRRETRGTLIDFKLINKLITESLPLMFAGIAIVLYSRIDQIMLKHYLSSSAVGVYSVAVQLAESWYFVPIAIASSVFPAIVKAKKKSEELYYQTLHYFSGITITFSFLVILIFVFFGKSLILLLYGEDYIGVSTVLSIYSFAGVMAAFGVFWGKWVVIENLQLFQFYMQVGVAVLNIILNVTFIPYWGIEGAAIATAVSYTLGFVLTGALSKKLRKMTGIMLASIFTLGLYPFFKYQLKKYI